MRTPVPMISVAWLDEQFACPEQADLALLHFGPEPRPLTRNLLREAAELGLDVSWLAERILPTPLWAEYDRQRAPLLAEYDRQRAPLLAEYERQCDPLWAEFERQRAPLLAEYGRQRAPLLAEYLRQCDPLLAEYERQCAPLLANLLDLPEGT